MLNVAIKAARAAGAIINRASLDVESVRVSQKQSNDFVTEVDHAAEQAIIETLLTAYPQHGILAEESGQERGKANSDYLWIIDPLDGTTNFIHGFPVYCVSIALQVRGKMEQAVIYDGCEVMARIGQAAHHDALKHEGVRTTVMKGREYRDYIDLDETSLPMLGHWIELALKHNQTLPNSTPSSCRKAPRSKQNP